MAKPIDNIIILPCPNQYVQDDECYTEAFYACKYDPSGENLSTEQCRIKDWTGCPLRSLTEEERSQLIDHDN